MWYIYSKDIKILKDCALCGKAQNILDREWLDIDKVFFLMGVHASSSGTSPYLYKLAAVLF